MRIFFGTIVSKAEIWKYYKKKKKTTNLIYCSKQKQTITERFSFFLMLWNFIKKIRYDIIWCWSWLSQQFIHSLQQDILSLSLALSRIFPLQGTTIWVITRSFKQKQNMEEKPTNRTRIPLRNHSFKEQRYTFYYKCKYKQKNKQNKDRELDKFESCLIRNEFQQNIGVSSFVQ